MLRTLKQAAEDFRNALRAGPDAAGGRATAIPPREGAAPTPSPPPDAVGPATWPNDLATPLGEDDQAGGAAVAAEAGPAPARRLPGRAVWAGAGLLALVGIVGLLRWAPWSPREPADPAVVATFRGGVITNDALRLKLDSLPREEQARFRTAAGLRALVDDLVFESTIRQWAQERQVDQREAVKDAMKHATEEIQLADVSQQLHEGRIPVGEGEIQEYYDRNRQRFGERPLVEVREQVRQTVVEEKEQGFVQEYLKDLRERSSLQIDYSLLDGPEPAEQELVTYYQTNRERFRVPEQADIAQIQVSVSLAGGDERARTRAEAVRGRAAAGEDFGQLAREISDGPERAQGGELATPVARGSLGQAFDEAVFALPVGGLSTVFRNGDSYYVVKLLQSRPERTRPYEEARGEIAATLRAEREQQVYSERAGRTLFSIHGRRTTLGEFLQELNELPPAARALDNDVAAKRKILDNLIERLLVIEDASEQASDAKGKDEIEHARVDLLAQFLHDEEVDSKLQVSDDEIRAAYDRDRGHYAEPARVKVRYIRVGRGRTADADQKARARIEEAASKVRPTGLLGSGGPPADFGEVAREYSEDRATAAQGGALDRWITESNDPMAEAFEHPLHEALFPLNPGEVSPILTLGDSYYLFQITDKQEARQRSFEEAQELVQRDLEAHKHAELSRSMQRQLADRMQLQVYDGRLASVLGELGARADGSR